jgi:Mrp family chromosome partitioning ATPase
MSLSLERGSNVTLIDGNLDDDSRADGSQHGLLDYLENPAGGIERALNRTSIPNLRILPRGRTTEDAPELVGGSGMANLLRAIVKTNSDFAVIDTGAVLAGASAVALAPHAGQLVFVVEKDRTRRSEVEESLGLLDRVGGAIDERWVGFVFNKADPSESLARHRV